MILSYHPQFIKIKDVEELVNTILRAHNCPVHTIMHYDPETQPLYCVQICDDDSDDD